MSGVSGVQMKDISITLVCNNPSRETNKCFNTGTHLSVQYLAFVRSAVSIKRTEECFRILVFLDPIR